jgi:hypothetical protein
VVLVVMAYAFVYNLRHTLKRLRDKRATKRLDKV